MGKLYHANTDQPVTAESRFRDRIARIDAAVSRVASECGVSPSVVNYVWHNACRSGEGATRIGPFMSFRKPGPPQGTKAALRAGVIGTPTVGSLLFALAWFAPFTPLGRRILWRITEETDGL